MALAERSTTNIRALKMRVEGMDCSACALKIDNALKRLPGVSNINVNYGTETLVLNVGRRPHVACDNRREDSQLGYAPQAVAGTAPEATEWASQLDLAWWQTRKGQVVIVNAALLATAVVVPSIPLAYRSGPIWQRPLSASAQSCGVRSRVVFPARHSASKRS